MLPRILQLRHPRAAPFRPVPSVGPTHYELLRVEPGASRDQLRQAFRSLSKRYHPDTTELPAADAEQAFRQLKQAYAVLSDPLARQRYDSELRLGTLTSPSPLPAPRPTSNADVRRALSGGEWLALLLLGLALIFSLVLGVGLALARGTALVQWPSWWSSTDPITATTVEVSSEPL
jgi:preprotein translocase subunit Sec63